MRIKDAVKVMLSALTRNRPIVLVGAPGGGKSSVVQQVSDRIAHELHVTTPVLWDITDPKGLPMPHPEKKDQAVFLPFGEVAKMLAATKPTVWFIDDVGQASEDVQAALMPLILNRTIAGRKLPDCVKMILATNGVEHQAAVNPMLSPLKTRMAAFIHLESHIDDWTDWAMPRAIEPMLIAFLRYKPDYLHVFEDTAEMRAHPCPRVWGEGVNGWLADQRNPDLALPEPVLDEVIGSLVTGPIATEFATFRAQYKTMAQVDKIFLNPKGAVIPEKADELYAVTTAIASHVTTATFPAALKYAARLAESKKGDFAVLLTQLCTSKDATLAESRANVDFRTKYQDLYKS